MQYQTLFYFSAIEWFWSMGFLTLSLKKHSWLFGWLFHMTQLINTNNTKSH